MPRSTLTPLILILATALAYGRIINHEFTLWDDPGTVTSNPHLNPPSWSGMLRYWRESEHGLYIPITYTAWFAIATVAQRDQPDHHGLTLDSWPFHLANLLAHIAATLVVFAILRQIIARAWSAALGALLFALHPVQVESVAWVSGLKDVLAGLFGLIALWQYIRFVKRAQAPNLMHAGSRFVDTPDPQPGPKGPGVEGSRAGWFAYTCASLALILALLSKPSAMVVPLMALAIDALILRRGLRAIALSLGPWFLLAAAAAVVAKLVQSGVGVPHTPIWARPLVVGDALAFYLYKLIYPVQLGIDYGRRPPIVMQHWWFYVTWLAPALIGAWLLLFRRRAPMLLLAGCLFVAGVLPMLGWTRFMFQQYSTTADHYLYLAMLGPALALAWLISRSNERRTYIIASIVLVLLGLRTIVQTRHWSDSKSLFRHTLAVNPQSYTGHNNLGTIHYHAGDFEQAEWHFRKAIELRGDLTHAHTNLANVLAVQGRVDEAIEQIRAELRIKERQPPEMTGDFSHTYLHLGELLIQRRRYAEAIEELQRLLRAHPQHQRGRELLEVAREKTREM